MGPVEKLHETYASKGLVVIGIHVQNGVDQLESFTESNAIKHPMCGDPTGAASEAYGVTGIPTFVLVDKRGIARGMGHGVPTGAQIEALLSEE